MEQIFHILRAVEGFRSQKMLSDRNPSTLTALVNVLARTLLTPVDTL